MLPDTSGPAAMGRFTINRDRDTGPDNREGMTRYLRGTKVGPRRTFRLLDDDGTILFQGVMIADPDTCTDFEPLDWAAACYGCTEIQYRQADGSWRTL